MKYLFPNFLVDIQQYTESQKFWEDLCLQILSKHRQSDLWIPWLGAENILSAADNAILYEGNPMYWLDNPIQLKSVRIIQQDPKIHTKWEMATWIDVVGDEHSELGLIKQLVFTCNLTLETANVFEKLFEAWLQPETDAQAMEEMIKNLGIN
jgi:hypothetical protein